MKGWEGGAVVMSHVLFSIDITRLGMFWRGGAVR